MNSKAKTLMAIVVLLVAGGIVQGRIKLVALPERADTVIRLDNPQWTLIEEERVLTLQQGENKVDFSWKGVSIDSDSIRLQPLDHPDPNTKEVVLRSVSYPPGEAALVWEIYCDSDYAERVRISYLLRNIDRLITYKAIADKAETMVDLTSFLVLRNFSGEDFEQVKVLLDYGKAFDKQGTKHEETKQLLFLKKPEVPITKVWTFDSARQIWDPREVDENVGIPVSYRIVNDAKSGLGEFALWGGKARLFQDDGRESTIFLGEDVTGQVPVNEKTELYIGDSRDIVVTQVWDKKEDRDRLKNNSGNVVLKNSDEIITAKIENFKDSPAVLTMIQHITGEWDMIKCTLDGKKAKYINKGCKLYSNRGRGIPVFTLEFEIKLDARTDKGPATRKLFMHYIRKNIRGR
jgi:hypothetical protein